MRRFPATLVAVFLLPLYGRILSCDCRILEDICRSETVTSLGIRRFFHWYLVLCVAWRGLWLKVCSRLGFSYVSVLSSIATLRAWRFQHRVVPPYPRVMRSKNYCGYKKPRIIPTALYNMTFVLTYINTI
jgi:hypothetical protein